jgi:hypothetical protein
VLAEAPTGQLFWPGPTDVVGLRSQADRVHETTVDAAYGGGFPNRPLRLDAAFVPLRNPSTPHLGHGHGLGPLAPLAVVATPDLSLVGRRVFAAGATSGGRRGVIVGLLYEEYGTTFAAIADCLIASADDAARPMSNKGDSGGVWCLQDTQQPLALNCRQQLLTVRGQQHQLAIASNLSLALTHLGATIP